MASRAKAVGSAAWIAAEKENVINLVEQEMEEVQFPVMHELDWLNEHMAEIFSRNQFDMTEVFKTPGKLRGKTPRTARKRNPAEVRVPLGDVFSPNLQNLQPKTPQKKEHVTEKSAEKPKPKPIDRPVERPEPKRAERTQKEGDNLPEAAVNNKLNSFSTYNTDSGYYGNPDMDDEVVMAGTQATETSTQPLPEEPEEMDEDTQDLQSPSLDRTTEISFHSAQEEFRQRAETVEPGAADERQEDKPNEETPRPSVQETALQTQPVSPEKPATLEARPASPGASPAKDVEDDHLDDIGSPSDKSTPERPVVRKKSSLSFASLPAREPLVTKKSMGHRVSRVSHVEAIKTNAVGRQSYFSSQIDGMKMATGRDAPRTGDEKADLERKNSDPFIDDSDMGMSTTKLPKSSTQRLHEKISMLGKSQPGRTKSILGASRTSTSQVVYPELPNTKPETSSHESRATPAPESTSQEDWIKPLGSPLKSNISRTQTVDVFGRTGEQNLNADRENSKPQRPQTAGESRNEGSPLFKSPFSRSAHTKIPAEPESPSPERSENRAATPTSKAANSSATPSPKRFDAALSGPKAKFQSLMKTAKGLFMSSASISAAAKLESSPAPRRSPSPGKDSVASPSSHPQSPLRDSPSPQRVPTQSRHDAEMIRIERAEQDQERGLQEAPARGREQERPPTAQEPEPVVDKTPAPGSKDFEKKVPLPTPSLKSSPAKVQNSQTQSAGLDSATKSTTARPAAPRQPARPSKAHERRLVRPTREAVQKPKPQPVSIRVGSTLSRMPLTTASLSSSVQEQANLAPTPAPAPASTSAPAPTPSKQPTLAKKASSSSLQTATSNSSLKTTASSQSQRRTPAEKKKQEEREAALRREEQKKRVAQQQRQHEEARRQERERSVPEDPKRAAQRQAIDQRRMENARRMERQGSQPPRTATETNSGSQQDKSTAPARPPSRIGSAQPLNRSVNHPPVNPAKPAKRALEDESQRGAVAGAAHGSDSATDSKRRKTEDEYNPPPMGKSHMAPPIRQPSGIRKESYKPSILSQNYPQAPPPAAHHQPASSVYRSAQPGTYPAQHTTAAPQRPAHPMDMAKYATGKIPFAEAPNPQPAAAHKTPGQSQPRMAPAKSSPQYPNGENIHLPEINTDSEDSDSDNDMLPCASWAQPEELNRILREQEGVSTEEIFGPIAPFSLEEAFKSDKKVKKYRNRTSSANWAAGDGLTQEEIAEDNAARQRLRQLGGWSYDAF